MSRAKPPSSSPPGQAKKEFRWKTEISKNAFWENVPFFFMKKNKKNERRTWPFRKRLFFLTGFATLPNSNRPSSLAKELLLWREHKQDSPCQGCPSRSCQPMKLQDPLLNMENSKLISMDYDFHNGNEMEIASFSIPIYSQKNLLRMIWMIQPPFLLRV